MTASSRLRAKAVACLLSGATALSFVMSDAAKAQTTQAEKQTTQAENTTGIGDIVVTANRRAERSQDVPTVVNAFSTEQLQQQNITKPQDLYGSVPSLTSGSQGQATRDVQSYSIRGQSTGFLASPGVQLYMNEVPLPSSISLNLQGAPGMFIDMANVQILSGPQGTLFGRNTTGGAVLFEPHRPTDELGGYIEGSLGNLNLRAVEGAINLPVVQDKLSIRVSGVYHDRDGYTYDQVWDKYRDNEHYYAGRVGILFKPVAGVENLTTIYGTKSSNNGAGHVLTAFNMPYLQSVMQVCTGLTQSVCDAAYANELALAKSNGPRVVRDSTDAYSRIDSWGIINSTNIDLTDTAKLRNIISFQKLKDDYASDQDGTPFQMYELTEGARLPSGAVPNFAFAPPGGYRNTAGYAYPRDYLKQFTEELQIQGTALSNKLNYSVGGFYYDATPAGMWGGRAVQYVPAAFTGFTQGTDGRSGVSNRSKALYAQATLDLGALTPSLDKLRLTGGYRYTWDTIHGFSSSWSLDNGTCQFGPPAGLAYGANDPTVFCNYEKTLNSKAGTWVVGLDYKPVNDLLIYAKVSRGYKAGGFNTFAVRAETRTFDPEFLTSYEGGCKSDFRLGSAPVRLNATYFYSKYKNIQRPGGDFFNGHGGARIYSADATIQGVEVEASVRPVDILELGTNFSYLKGKYDKYEVTNLGQVTGLNSCGPGSTAATVDFSCIPFQFLTPWIVNVHGTLNLPVSESFAKASLYVAYSYLSSQNVSPTPGEPGAILESYSLLNANLSLRNIAQTGFDLSFFGNNLTNKLYRVSNNNGFFGQGLQATLYGEPRTFGVKLRYSFGGR